MDVITFGEALIIFSPAENGPLRFVNNFSKSIGGAEANVAIALSRLGNKVGWISRLGDDEFGRYVKYALQGDGVDLSQITLDSELPTGLLFKEKYHSSNPTVYYYRKGAAITNFNQAMLDENYIKQAKIMHVTGIFPALADGCREATFHALKLARENGVTVSFDPNLRLKLWDRETARQTLLEMAKYADIVLPGIDEAEFLFGTTNPTDAIAKFHDLGAKIVALKLGKDGCMVSDGNNSVTVTGYHAHNFIDSVGAGDGFAAGFLTGYLGGKSLMECGQFANGVGAMATLVRGDSEGYPSMKQLLEFIGHSTLVDR